MFIQKNVKITICEKAGDLLSIYKSADFTNLFAAYKTRHAKENDIV